MQKNYNKSLVNFALFAIALNEPSLCVPNLFITPKDIKWIYYYENYIIILSW